jgi:5-histidylcysteine sulfoxide synthase/putative 4-mercaptohistidine N1-methyltranferase
VIHNESDSFQKKCRKTINLISGHPSEMRAELKQYFLETFNTYESLFKCLSQEDAFYKKPINLRHPLIFYYGHTAAFYINKLNLAKVIDYRVNKPFEAIFAVGVDEMSWDDLDDNHYEWPSVRAVQEYRDQVKAVILNLLDDYPLTLPIDWENPWWAFIMGIEHELIHLETSSVLIRQHQLQYVQNHGAWQPAIEYSEAPENQLIHVESGTVQHAKDTSDQYYGWDNEYGQHESAVSAFKASQCLVSNHEFLGFVQAGGYEKLEFWEAEGHDWLMFAKAAHPEFWVLQDGQWHLRLMTQEVPMPWSWPVEVNYHEAKAFCNWKKHETGQNYRLPTEDEWYRLYSVSGMSEDADANIQLKYHASSCAVNQFQHGDFFDIQGNVWQWTETAIYPYEQFAVHPIYDDFSTPTFDSKHNLIKGGSWISCGNEALASSRYAFRRHFFQHAGFRYVVSNDQIQHGQSYYETDTLVSQYLDFHFGPAHFAVNNFAAALVEMVKDKFTDQKNMKALDIGCATGRASFDLSKYFDSVLGIDFSARFIRYSAELQKGETVYYKMPYEGNIVTYESCSLKNFDFYPHRDKVEFMQGDACNLKQNLKDFDFVLASNLIDRLHDPKAFLMSLKRLVKLGGYVLIASPYTWDEAYTPMENWLGGIKKLGENFTALEGLHEILDGDFQLEQPPIDVPFVIKETNRKFQHTVSQATLWKRIQ